MAELADLLNEYTEALEPVEILLILQLFVKETEAFIPKENN